MKSFELAPDVDRNQIIAPAVRKTKAVIEEVLDATHPTASATWEFQQRHGPRELVLRLTDGERQSEKSFRLSELSGNGAFKQQLLEMSDTLAHNGDWREAVRDLARNVKEWSKAIPESRVTEHEVNLNEERSGVYRLPRLTIEVGAASLQVEPIAGWAITPTGASVGRSSIAGMVELKGSGGPMHLYFLSNKQWVYQQAYVSPTADPNLYAILDGDGFVKLARECLDV